MYVLNHLPGILSKLEMIQKRQPWDAVPEQNWTNLITVFHPKITVKDLEPPVTLILGKDHGYKNGLRGGLLVEDRCGVNSELAIINMFSDRVVR